MRACDWGFGPREGGGDLDPSDCSRMGLVQWRQSPLLVPQAGRGLLPHRQIQVPRVGVLGSAQTKGRGGRAGRAEL